MYLDYWHLKEKPFQNTTDPRFLCLSEQHEEAFTRLKYVVDQYQACALLTGIFGSGKTLLAQALIDVLPRDQYTTAYIFNPQLGNVELLREIVYQLGIHHQVPDQKTDILHRLFEMLTDAYSEGRHTVIIVDEAHLIEEKSIFEELRLLLNYQKRDRFLLTLVLVGQPELREKIVHLKPFDQRISMRFHLKGLRLEETKTYILHRLKVAGREEPVFEEETFQMIYESTGGLPRRINQVCDLALLTAFGTNQPTVSAQTIREVVTDAQNV
ncbi:MAG: AAA family ATPase [Candidatus Omnitrophica bacterium]|nr:AAA family ATPase [Candidatus Omnitrophota bacterium]